MTALFRYVGRLASILAVAEVSSHVLSAISSFLHISVAGLAFGILAVAMSASTNSVKSKTTEARLNAMSSRVPNIPQTSPGTVSSTSSAATNSSFNISNHTNNDGNSGPYWATGERNFYNTLQSDWSNAVPAFNQLRNDFSSLVPEYNTLRSDVINLINSYNSLINRLTTARVIQ